MMTRVLVSLLVVCAVCGDGPYQPTWESLDARPLPAWYDQAKIGIFIHWGVFSVSSFDGAMFWKHWKEGHSDHVRFMKDNYPPDFTYADFAPQLTTELFDPSQWADLFQRSGARYVVLTAKHHEGFCLWPSTYSWNWNSMDVGPRRDLVGELAEAVRNRTDLVFGLYHSLYEWYNPLYLQDLASGGRRFVEQKTLPELYELVERYRPEVIWSDGDWDQPDTYWRSRHFLAWLYNQSPVRNTVVTNDRWGKGTMCQHGGFLTCRDRYNPGVLQARKFENCFTLDLRSWGYNRRSTFTDYMTIERLLETVVSTVSCGGNVLINVGPTKDGTIMPIFEERLTQLGHWLRVNGDAIYGSRPWVVQNDTLTPGVWYTLGAKGDVYATVLHWPRGGLLTLGAVKSIASCQMLGHGPLKTDGNRVRFPNLAHVGVQWAWVLKLETTPKRKHH